MLMQMLAAGGVDLFTDSERAADASNPRGYYEHRSVAALDHSEDTLGSGSDHGLRQVIET